MKLSGGMKRQALQALEAAHHAKAKGLLERLRIFDWSLKEVAESWRRARAARFLSIAEPETFDAEAAEALVENADAIIAGLAGVAREQVVVTEMLSMAVFPSGRRLAQARMLRRSWLWSMLSVTLQGCFRSGTTGRGKGARTESCGCVAARLLRRSLTRGCWARMETSAQISESRISCRTRPHLRGTIASANSPASGVWAGKPCASSSRTIRA
jgi:hypothetical protein